MWYSEDRSTATKNVTQIHDLRKEASWNDAPCLVQGSPFDAFHNLKNGSRKYLLLSKTGNDLDKHILTACDKDALSTLVILLEEYQHSTSGSMRMI